MRKNSDKDAIEALMNEMGNNISERVNIYFNGGATAVLHDFRKTTIDVDMAFEPDISDVYKAIHYLKEKLDVNIEIASPSHFIPALKGWKERSIFIKTIRFVSFFHYDLYSQIIAKVQRGWVQDMKDALNFASLISKKNIDELSDYFSEARPQFIQYPSVNPDILEKKLKQFIRDAKNR